MPNIDLLSPFRVHLVAFAETGLKITVVCYFATKSFDEFLYLQQIALLEITRVVSEASATMTSVLHVDIRDPRPAIPKTMVEDIVISSNTPGGSQEHDALNHLVFEEQVAVRKINGSTNETSTAASRVTRSSGGTV